MLRKNVCTAASELNAARSPSHFLLPRASASAAMASMSTGMMRMRLTALLHLTNTVLRNTPTGALWFVTKTE